MDMKKNMNNREIAGLLRAVSAAYEIKGENIFRIRAYDSAADSVDQASREIKDLWEEGKLKEIPGIGPNIAGHLEELFNTGKVRHFQEVFKEFPPAMFELLDVPGIGPKSAFKLTKELGINIAEGATEKLLQEAKTGKIRTVEGFGIESELQIIKGLEEFSRREDRMLLTAATQLAEEFVSYMKKEKACLRVEPLGSLRRRAPTVGDLDLAVATRKPEQVIKAFTAYPGVKKVLAAGDNTARVIHTSGRQVDVKTQTPQRFGALLQHFTGSKSHNIHLREIAIEKGLSLSEHGIKKVKKLTEFASEDKFYQALDMKWIPPELREDSGEIEAAQKGSIPKLVELKDIKGDLHLHTNYSWISSHDAGVNSMKEMIEKAVKLGYEYVAIGDHNPSTSSYSPERIVAEVKERSKLLEEIKYSYENKNTSGTIKVLNTLEVDILNNGKLAVPDEGLNLLDFAVVSIHSSMRMGKDKMTARILSGFSHSKAKILGHPTGRLLNKREGFEADWDTIFRFAKEKRKFIEINAWPSRLDLPDTLVRRALNFGVQLVIDTDAHAAENMKLMRYGVDVARRGWCAKSDIINTLSYAKIIDLLTK